MSVTALIEQIEQHVIQWDGVTAVPHPRFGGRQFDWNKKEIGHIHWNGDLDILFNKAIHDTLLKDGYVKEHKWIPGSGWTTHNILAADTTAMAIELLKLSYLLKRKRTDRQKDFSTEISSLQLSNAVKELV